MGGLGGTGMGGVNNGMGMAGVGRASMNTVAPYENQLNPDLVAYEKSFGV